jgi:hypothetical protein
MVRRTAVPAIVIFGLTAIAALHADEQMVPLAISGEWIAFEHRTSLIAPPDVCVVGNPVHGIALRAGFEGLQFRASDRSWSLPTGVRGNIWITIGDWQTILDIDENSDTMVNAEVSSDIVTPMFAAMDRASAMLVTIGKAKPTTVSLVGSTRATNAFRTCAGIRASGNLPGANPFQ